MAIDLERHLVGPELLSDLEGGIATPRLYCQQPSTRREAARQRREHTLYLEVGAHARAPRLRGKHEVVVLEDPARLRDHGVEQELVVLAVDHQHRRAHQHGIARFRAGLRLPAVCERAAEVLDLLRVLVRGHAVEAYLLPVERCRELGVARHQAGGFGVVEVGDHEHGSRVLDQPVGQFLEAEPYVLEADLLGDDQQRHRRELAMRAAHDSRDHRTVAHTGVEDPHGRRRRSQQRDLVGGAARYRRFLVAGIYEGQVLLAVVIEAKRRRRPGTVSSRRGYGRRRGRDIHGASAPELHGRDPRAFDHRRELQIGDVGFDRPEAGEGAEAAVRAGDDALAADDLREALDALGDQ